MNTGRTYVNYAPVETPKSLKNKGVQVQSVNYNEKQELVDKIQNAIKVYNNEIDQIKKRYETDLAESGMHISNLQDMNEKLMKEIRDKDRLINQLKNNLSLMDDQISDLKRDRDKLKSEVDFFRDNGILQTDNLRKTASQYSDINNKILEIKNIINQLEANISDKDKVKFYRNILDLVNLANDSQNGRKLTSKEFIDYFVKDIQKQFGKGYGYYELDKAQLLVEPRFDPDMGARPGHKSNKSETRPTSANDFLKVSNNKRSLRSYM